jgi:malate dehydrogenase (oxaloacetate-decarboxylating)(NADP+)
MIVKITREEAMEYHIGGKIGLQMTKRLDDSRALSLAYTPGVADVCNAIVQDQDVLFSHTAKSNLVAVITDGTAVLGLGDIGARAGLPVMEGKCVLFKNFGEVDAWPILVENARANGNTGRTDPAKLIEIAASVSGSYGGINLEDIAAPECFEVEDRLQEKLDIPVFHDDQWGTAVITLAGVKNYCILTGKGMDELSVVINGAGAAGIRIADMLTADGVKKLLILDTKGVCHSGRADLNDFKRKYAVDTAKRTFADSLAGADLAVMVSRRFNNDGSRTLEPQWIKQMAHYPAIFAMANPDPEIYPEEVAEALGDKPYIMSTGRSDYPNQINNVLGFPFIFRGALDVRAKKISMAMKIAAAEGLALLAREKVPSEVGKAYGGIDLSFGPEYIIPKPFDRRLLTFEALAVAKAAVRGGVARITDISQYPKYLSAMAFTPKKAFSKTVTVDSVASFNEYPLLIPIGGKIKSAFICEPNVQIEGVELSELTGKKAKLNLSDGKVKSISPA